MRRSLVSTRIYTNSVPLYKSSKHDTNEDHQNKKILDSDKWDNAKEMAALNWVVRIGLLEGDI